MILFLTKNGCLISYVSLTYRYIADFPLDNMTYQIAVLPFSCVLALIITVLFAVIVNILMRRQIRRLNMAESLKAVE